MSDTMLFGVLRMPYDMAMGDDWSRWQYHQRGIEAADTIEAQAEKIRVLREALAIAEAALADIGDADREPGDDLAWCEARASEALPVVRATLGATK